MNLKSPPPPGTMLFLYMEVDTTGMFWVQKYRFNIEWGERGGTKISIFVENSKRDSGVLSAIVWKYYLVVSRTYLVIRGYFLLGLLRLSLRNFSWNIYSYRWLPHVLYISLLVLQLLNLLKSGAKICMF